ncbi:DUF1827 family protein [Ligilactobacillus sp. WILCCON 0076]|uniref:DUF1827 family protein n=1 Tax=Ligilactobacillus ubinensis TaxID=2876789 RepID=A0A9X2FLU9_9LACO|nr:DUF1827 family protein [Ligilactobacillus ubinensis]MCP0887927.1 DUF1827 family protein [Ligilactobacillus ubinensis]
MILTDVTNSYSRFIHQELRDSTAHFIKVYSLGNSHVVYKKKQQHSEIIISNKIRPVTDKEVQFVIAELLDNKQITPQIDNANHNVVQISWDNI